MALSAEQFRQALRDPHVRKQRVLGYQRGVSVDAAVLLGALSERDLEATEEELDRHVRELGGQRVDRSRYFLPELVYQRIRQTRTARRQ